MVHFATNVKRMDGDDMTNEEFAERLKDPNVSWSDLCEALGIAVINFNSDEIDVIFSGSRVHYELRNKTYNYQMVTPFENQKSKEAIRAWFKANHRSADFPEGEYVIVKVTETEKVEVVEELEG